MTVRSSSSTFVGRAHELERLEDALRRASEGMPTTVLLGGDAGVGKSRLVAELSGRVRARGGRVLVGGCLALGEGGLPYMAVTEALRGLAEDLGPAGLQWLAGDDARDLQRLVPALRAADAEDPGPGAGLDASSQVRLFEALLRLFERLAADGLLLVVLEDVHWADASTRDLLVFLAHSLRVVGAILVATFRTDELHRQHPLRPLLGRVSRGATVERLDLGPFGPDELALLLEGILGDAPGPELVERVFDRSQGNAFFAEELLAAGGSQAADLPDSLRETLLVAVDELPAPAAHVLRVAAAVGREAQYELLGQVADVRTGDLDAALRLVVERGLLVPDPDAGTYRFRHALLAEAVYATLLPGERGRLHAAVATALAADPRLATRSVAAELAHHWQAAGDQPRALTAALAAARDAEAAAGVAEARVHVERALELWPHVGDAAKRAGLDHTSLMEWAAGLSYLTGEPERAVALQEQALEGADHEPGRRALMLERLGRFRWIAGDTVGARATYADAVRLMPAEPPTLERAQVLSSYSQILMLCFQHAESEDYAEQAIAMARAIGARAVEAHALTNLGTTRGLVGDAHGIELLLEARALAEELGAADDVIRTYMNHAHVLGDLGRLDEAVAVAAAGLERARQLGVERLWGGSLSSNLASAALYIGDWERADAVLRAAPRDSGGVGGGWAHLARAFLLAGRGELDTAAAELSAARQARAHMNDQSRAAFMRTELWLALLQDDAERVHAVIARRPPVDELPDEGAVELRALALQALADQPGEDPAVADAILAEVRDLAERLGAERPLGAAWAAVAEAEHARGTGARGSADRWATAVARCTAAGLAYHGAYARFRQAQALLESGRRDGVETLLTAAHDTASGLGARPLAGAVAGLATRARIDLAHAEGPAPGARFGLTPRETEVLGLLAAGRTNAEIAAQLYISKKTASVHVSNILRKLEVPTRGKAAAMAHRLGLGAP